MGVKERREREKDELRGRILDAARELFAKEGYEAVSMRRIAEVIEYSPTAIYLHFADKEALFHELCRNDFSKLAQVFATLSNIADPVERIRQSGRQYIRFAVEYPHHYRLMFMTPIHQSAADCAAIEKEPSRGDPDRDAYAFLHHAVSEAVAHGRFRPELTDTELLTQTLWAGVHGVAALAVTHAQDPWIAWAPLEERAATMCDSILRGLVWPDDKEETR